MAFKLNFAAIEAAANGSRLMANVAKPANSNAEPRTLGSEIARLAVSQPALLPPQVRKDGPPNAARHLSEGATDLSRVATNDDRVRAVPNFNSSWKELDQAYIKHHFACRTCISAGQGRGLRCSQGMSLWSAYSEIEPDFRQAVTKELGDFQ